MTYPSFSWLDVKIGLRMLVRYPGLTLVGTVSMAVAIALGSVFLESVNQFKNPRLPIRDGDRVVALAALIGLGSMRQVMLLLAADGIMLVVGLAACAVPLRRALRIAPTEALRMEG